MLLYYVHLKCVLDVLVLRLLLMNIYLLPVGIQHVVTVYRRIGQDEFNFIIYYDRIIIITTKAAVSNEQFKNICFQIYIYILIYLV